MPAAITACFAVGTFAGLMGAVGLACLRGWSRLVLWLSAFALAVDWAWVFGFSGAASIPIGVAVVSISLALVWVAEFASRRGMLI